MEKNKRENNEINVVRNILFVALGTLLGILSCRSYEVVNTFWYLVVSGLYVAVVFFTAALLQWDREGKEHRTERKEYRAELIDISRDPKKEKFVA